MNDLSLLSTKKTNTANGYRIQGLQEAYFGKKKNIIQIENLVQNIIDEFQSNPRMKLTLGGSKSMKEYVPKIESLIKEEFGFRDVVLNISYSLPCINAYTYFSPVFKKINSKVQKTDNGIKFTSSNMDLTMIVGSQFFMTGYTAPELVAIMLHEIGHNFFHNNNTGDVILANIVLCISTFGIGLVQRDIAMVIMPKWEALKAKTGLKYISDIVGNFQSTVSKIMSVVQTLTSPVRLPPISYLISKLINIDFFVGTKDEKFADNFATAYGYGPELASGLSKMTQGKGAMLDLPIYNTIEDIKSLPWKIISYMIDEHPNAYSRVKDQLKYASSEIDKVKDPKLKAQLKKQIKELETQVEVYNDDVINANIDKGRFASALFQVISGKVLDGASPHNLIGKKPGDDWKQFKTTGSSI